MTAEEVRDLIRLACKDAGAIKAWAAKHGISGAYVGDVLLGRREPAGKILDALGLIKVVTYRVRDGALTVRRTAYHDKPRRPAAG
jgi:hypothetical protein